MYSLNLKIFAVVVTYNRLELLKENLIALQGQTYNLEKIVIVNNNSTDGTTEYLNNNLKGLPLFEVVNLNENIGGSGGFYEGIKSAVSQKCDWVWIMDDDTIPTQAALEKLVEKTDIVKDTGFLGSKVLFTDGSPHVMNNVPPATNHIRKIQWNAFEDKKLLAAGFVSFVSCLINTEAIKKVGLPYKDFFIWGDDKEYTERMIDAGFFGGLVLDSIAYHKTKDNYSVDLLSANDSLAWKYFYGERNRVFIEKRNRSKKSFFLWFLLDSRQIKKTLKKIPDNKNLKAAVKKGRWKGIFFNPTIDFV